MSIRNPVRLTTQIVAALANQLRSFGSKLVLRDVYDGASYRILASKCARLGSICFLSVVIGPAPARDADRTGRRVDVSSIVYVISFLPYILTFEVCKSRAVHAVY